MTKGERLQEIKQQDQLYKVLDRYFDAGWREYIKGIQQENDISNIRMFKILSVIKGNEFVADLINFMRSTKNRFALLTLAKKPKGILLKDSRYKTIPELWIYKYTAGQYREGEVFIQIKEDRWITFGF